MRDWVLTRPVVLFEAQACRLAGDGPRVQESFERSRELLEAEAALARMPHAHGFDTATVREDVDHEDALSELEKLLQQPAFFSVHLLRLDPRWDPLRPHPRYGALMTLAATGRPN